MCDTSLVGSTIVDSGWPALSPNPGVKWNVAEVGAVADSVLSPWSREDCCRRLDTHRELLSGTTGPRDRAAHVRWPISSSAFWTRAPSEMSPGGSGHTRFDHVVSK